MRRLPGFILIGAGVLVSACSGQDLMDEINFRSNQLAGFHLQGISVYSGYSSSAYPQAGFDLNASQGLRDLGGDISYGASASLGWQYHREKADVAVLYTGTYGGMARYSNLNAFSQALSITANRMLTTRWTASLTASGQDATLAQFLFQPSTLSIVSGVPATFDDLAAALSVGQFTNAQAASMLTGAAVPQAAGRSLLLGNRVLSYTGQASLAYALSSRLSLHFASFAAAGQTRFGGQDSITPTNYVMPRSLGANAGIGLSYALSPRTDVGVNVEGNRTLNHFQSAYITTANAFLGRKMGTHWILRLQGGGSYSALTQQLQGTPKSRQMVGSGSLGFQAHMNTLTASYDRQAMDNYGFAVGTITELSGAWGWHRPGSRWSLSASAGQQQTRNTGFTSLSGWHATTGVSTNLNSHSTLSAQYVYLTSAGTYLGTYNTLAIHSVRLTLGWIPQAGAQR